jgi:hypothetical protein
MPAHEEVPFATVRSALAMGLPGDSRGTDLVPSVSARNYLEFSHLLKPGANRTKVTNELRYGFGSSISDDMTRIMTIDNDSDVAYDAADVNLIFFD